jgi:hypothetical protein
VLNRGSDRIVTYPKIHTPMSNNKFHGYFRTLYCAKGNYEFGISRVIKSLEPYNKKLGTDTWYYAKRCFLSLIENMSKHMIMMRDSVIQECIQFLECCESKSFSLYDLSLDWLYACLINFCAYLMIDVEANSQIFKGNHTCISRFWLFSTCCHFPYVIFVSTCNGSCVHVIFFNMQTAR